MPSTSHSEQFTDGFLLGDRNESAALKAIRKESTDVYNRLHSIKEDAAFVSRVVESYPNFRVYPNLRCGAWYVDPQISQNDPVYFKSTDGHFGQWSFNLRRLNLHLLKVVSQCDGIVLVDSTRGGKRLPDALSKTIPIWCSVINLAVAKASREPGSPWCIRDSMLFTPPGAVSRSEHIQIESHLDAWATSLVSSEFSIPPLPKPLRPLWITPSTQTLPPLDSGNIFPVLCVSASKLVPDGVERRASGFVYVQGSGDDHESWSQGLTPQLYWQNQDQLLSSTRAQLPDLISFLVALSRKGEQHFAVGLTVPVARVNGRIAIGRIPAAASGLGTDTKAYVVIASGSFTLENSSPHILLLNAPAGKKGQHALLAHVLPRSLHFIKHNLQLGKDIAVLCDDGKDISVGVAVAALSLNFDDQGNYIENTAAQITTTKKLIHKRLQWVLADNTQANPSRTTLKRVNEFLMSPPRTR